MSAESNETKLQAAIVEYVLALLESNGVEGATSESTLFDLGFDSLESIDLVTRIEDELPVDVALVPVLLDIPSIAELAEGIMEEAEAEGEADVLASHFLKEAESSAS